jgi:hypothetical protein
MADGDVDVVCGERSTGLHFWEKSGSRTPCGVTLEYGPSAWPVQPAVAYYQWSDTEEGFIPFPFTTFEVRTRFEELSAGVLKTWRKASHTRPFLGVGVALVRVRLTGSEPGAISNSDSERSVGEYAEGGFYWSLAGHLNIGLHVRTLFGASVHSLHEDANYTQLGLLLGWGWSDKN